MSTIDRHLFHVLVLGASALATASAHAAPVTSVPVNIAASTITFTPYDGFTTVRQLPAATDVGLAENLESVVLSFNDVDPDRILGAVPTALGSNGRWPTDGAFAGLNNASGTMFFSFGRAMNFVGGFVNYLPGDLTTTISALNAQGDVIEESTLNFDFGNADAVGQGMFMGFSHASADIWGFALTNGNVVVDNLSFGTVAGVPEPGAATLVLAALAALGWQRRRRSSSAGQ